MLLLFHTTRLQRPDWPAEVHLYDDNRSAEAMQICYQANIVHADCLSASAGL